MIEQLRHMATVRPGMDRDAAQWALTTIAELRTEVERLRATLTKIRDVTGTSTEAHHFARNALEQQARSIEGTKE